MNAIDLCSEAAITKDAVEVLKSWSSSSKVHRLIVGVDVGGTNTRVAIKNLDEETPQDGYHLIAKFRSSTGKQLMEGLQIVAQQYHDIIKTIPLSACMDVAGPIIGTSAIITNYIPEYELKRSDLPSYLFPPSATTIINDLAAVCKGIDALSGSARLHRYFQPLNASSAESPVDKMVLGPLNYIVLAMGTGLGGAAMIFGNKVHHVVPLEFGHTSLTPLGPSHVDYEEEVSLIKYLSLKLWEGQHQIEWEDVCSGRGLTYIYEWASRDDPNAKKDITPPEVVELAIANPPNKAAEKAVYTHYKYLIRFANHLCVGMVARGVFLAGDNQVYNDSFVMKYADMYNSVFRHHSKGSWLTEVPIFRQMASTNLNLLGCVHVSERSLVQ